jgi:hypothetical protein
MHWSGHTGGDFVRFVGMQAYWVALWNVHHAAYGSLRYPKQPPLLTVARIGHYTGFQTIGRVSLHSTQPLRAVGAGDGGGDEGGH